MTIDSIGSVRISVYDSAPEDWDHFVRKTPSGSHAHLSGWGRVFARVFGHATRYFCVRGAAGELRAVLPVTLVRSVLFGRHAVSVPFLNYGGPVGEPEVAEALVNEAVHRLSREGYRTVQLRCREEVPLPWPPRFEKVLVLLPLADSSEAQMKQFDPKLRSQIRRAGKDGALAGVGIERLPSFYNVFAEHMRDLGTPSMPEAFFREAAAEFPGDVRIATVDHEGVAIAGGFGFVWRDEFEITWASSLIRYKKMAPNMLLYWTLISHCLAEGVRTFNFGRSTPGSGPHQFKRQWSDVEFDLPWYEAGAGQPAARPRKEAGAFRLATRVWRRLPLSVAKTLGPKIVRGIP